jgi:tetratricopeptide (TPR) repeat protein
MGLMKKSILFLFAICIFSCSPKFITDKEMITLTGLYNNGKYDECSKKLLNYIDMGYGSKKIFHLLANVFLHQGEFGKARKIINKYKSDNDFMIVESKILIIENKNDEAISLLENMRNKGNIGEETNILLGKLYYRKGDYNKALLYFNDALSMESKLSELYYDLGKVNVDLENYETGKMYIDKFKSINP